MLKYANIPKPRNTPEGKIPQVVYYWWSEALRKGRGLIFLVQSHIQKKSEVQSFGNEWEIPPQSLPSFQILIPHKEQPEESAWSDCCNNFEKNERWFSFKAINLQHLRLKMEKRWQKLWWCLAYVRFILPLQGKKYLRT